MQLKTKPFSRSFYRDCIYAVYDLYGEPVSECPFMPGWDDGSVRYLGSALLQMQTPETNALKPSPTKDLYDYLREIEDAHGDAITLDLLADFANLHQNFGQASQNEAYWYLLEHGFDEDRLDGYAENRLEL